MEKKWLILIVILIVIIFLRYWFYMRKANYWQKGDEKQEQKFNDEYEEGQQFDKYW